MKSLVSACNFSRFICTVISKGSLWRPCSSGDLGLSNENIIYPVTSELQEMVCWLFSDSLEIGSCGEGLWGFLWNMKQKVVWPFNLQYQVWEISEKCTHPFGKSCMEPFVCVPNLGFPPVKIFTKKKRNWEYLFQCNPFLPHVLNAVSVVFGPLRCNWQSSHWVARLPGWVRSGSRVGGLMIWMFN